MAVFSAIAAAFTAVGTWFAGLSAVGAFLVRVGVGLALNGIASAIARKKQGEAKTPGVTFQLQQGADQPRSFMLGRGATAGSLVYHNSWGSAGGTPNAYYTRITALSDLPVTGLAEVWLDGQLCVLDTANPDAEKGIPVVNYRTNSSGDVLDLDGEWSTVTSTTDHCWIKFYDGNQTTADAFVMEKVATDARPWSSLEVGVGVAYAIMTCRFNQELYQGAPRAMFVLDGIPLEDPSTGQIGTGDKFPALQAYHLLKGISYNGEWFYGLQNIAEARFDLPEWIANIEKCRVPVPGASSMTATELQETFGSSTVPSQYLSGGEISVDIEIGNALEAILTGCNGRLVDTGWKYRVLIGPVGGAVATLTDGDILSTEEQTFTPFFGLADITNGITAIYPEPSEEWQSQAAPPLYVAEYEAEDGNRRLLDQAEMSMVPYKEQVQRLMAAALAEARRARRHTVALGPRYWALEPGDVISWSSDRNGYEDKLFRVDGLYDLPTADIIVDLTEVDPSDYDWSAATDFVPITPGTISPQPFPVQTFSGWAATPHTLTDASGVNRKPAILLRWDRDVDRVSGVRYQLRVKQTAKAVVDAQTASFEAGGVILSEGISPDVEYQVRGIYLVPDGRPVSWSAWLDVTTPDVRVGPADLATTIMDQITDAQAAADQAADDAAAAHDAADDVQESLDAAVASLTVDYNATQQAATNAQTARDEAEAARNTAATHAATADGARGLAQTAQSAAEAARDLASSAAASAQGHSDSAEASSSIAASVAQDLLPHDFEQGGSFWTHSIGGDPDVKSDWSHGSFVQTTERGKVARLNMPVSANVHLAPKSYVKGVVGRKIKITFEARFVGTPPSGGAVLRSQFRIFAGDFSDIGSLQTVSNAIPGDGSFATFSHVLTVSSASHAYILPFLYWASVDDPDNGYYDVSFIKIEDVTESAAAQSSADAAATSESQASAFKDDAQAASSASSAAQVAAEAARDSSQTSAASSASSASSAAASETAAGQSASAAQSSATGAATDASNASTSASDAATSASDAAGSSSTAASQASAAASSANNAGNSASASAASAQAAATSATESGQSASAANSDRIAAQTARGGAEAAQTASVAAQQSAEGHSSAAAASATLSAGSAQNAAQSANAASTSEQSAAASETAAGQSASAAQSSASSAQTSAGQASTSASNAATSATNAAGSAQNASTSSEVAVSIARDLMPHDFRSDGLFWSHSISGDPDAKSSLSSQFDFRDVSGFGRVAYMTPSASPSNLHLAPKGYFVPQAGRKYRLTVVARHVGPIGSGVSFSTQIRKISEAYAYISASSAHNKFAAPDVWETFVHDWTFTGVEAAYLLPFAYTQGSYSQAGAEIEFAQVLFEDITESDAAATSASAAAISASAASASETAAGVSATSATSSANSASTSAGSASASQSSAATSASLASGSANEASTSATLAAQTTAQGAGVLVSPYFADYGAGGGWVNWSGGVTSSTPNEVYAQGKTLQFTTANDDNKGAALTVGSGWSGPENAEAYVVEVVFTLVSGSLVGAGVLLDWNQTSGERRRQFVLSDMLLGSLVLGQVMYASKVFKRPTLTADFTTHDVYLMANFSGFGTREAKNIKFHRMQIRPATPEEIGSGEVGDAISAAVSTEAGVRASEDQAIAASVSALSATVGGVSASVTTQGAAIADLEGNAAASLVFRTQAGSSGAALELVSADDPDGATSVARITADNILLEGSVGTDMLTVGLGRNLLTNTDFSDGLNGWNFEGSGDQNGQASVSVRPPGAWSGAYFPVLQIYQNSTGATGVADLRYRPYVVDGVLSVGMSVEPGQWLEAGAQMSIHRCVAEVRIQYYDQTGASIGYSPVLGAGNGVNSSSTNPEVWPRYWGKHQAPSNAAFATIHIRKGPTNSGSNSYVMIHKPQLALSHASATSPAPFSPGGTTLITGGKIATGSVTAADAVFETGAIRTADIGDLQVDTLKIKDQAVTIPVYVQDNNLVNVYSSWIDVASLTIDREGYSTALQFMAQIDGYDDGALMFGFKRNGVAFNNGFTCYIAGNGSQTAIAIGAIDSHLGTGVTTYQVQARVVVNLNGHGRVYKKFFSAHQFKK